MCQLYVLLSRGLRYVLSSFSQTNCARHPCCGSGRFAQCEQLMREADATLSEREAWITPPSPHAHRLLGCCSAIWSVPHYQPGSEWGGSGLRNSTDPHHRPLPCGRRHQLHRCSRRRARFLQRLRRICKLPGRGHGADPAAGYGLFQRGLPRHTFGTGIAYTAGSSAV